VVDTAKGTVGRDELGRGDAVRRQAELARVPAEAAAERVAGDADVRGRPVQRGEAVLGRDRDDVAPLCAGAHPRDAALDVDLYALQRVGLDEDDVVQRAERLGVVTGALRGHLHALRPG
jgi:hypothetical protein